MRELLRQHDPADFFEVHEQLASSRAPPTTQKHPSLLDGIPDSLDGVIPSKATAIATGTTTVAYRAGQDDGQWGDEGGGGDGGGVMDTSGDKSARGG